MFVKIFMESLDLFDLYLLTFLENKFYITQYAFVLEICFAILS